MKKVKYQIKATINYESEKIPISPISFIISKEPFKKITTYYLLSFAAPFAQSQEIKNILHQSITNPQKVNFEISIYIIKDKINSYSEKLIYKNIFVPLHFVTGEYIQDIKTTVIFKLMLVPLNVFKLLSEKPDKNIFDNFSNYDELFNQIFSSLNISDIFNFYDAAPKQKNIPTKYLFQKILIPKNINKLDTFNFVVNRYKTHIFPTFYFYDTFSLFNSLFNVKDITTEQYRFSSLKDFYTVKSISFWYDYNKAVKKDIHGAPFKITYKKSVTTLIGENTAKLINCGKIILIDELGNNTEITIDPNKQETEIITYPSTPQDFKEKILSLKNLVNNINDISIWKIEDPYPFTFDIGALYSTNQTSQYTLTILESYTSFIRNSIDNSFIPKLEILTISYKDTPYR